MVKMCPLYPSSFPCQLEQTGDKNKHTAGTVAVIMENQPVAWDVSLMKMSH